MLAIGRALMCGPRLLLVDELSLGLMPKMVDLCLDALRKLNQEEGLAILLVEQNTARALDVAQQCLRDGLGPQRLQRHAETARRDVDLLHSYAGAAAALSRHPSGALSDDAGIGLAHVVARHHLVRHTFRQHLAGIEHDEPVGDPQHLAEIVLDQQRR